MTPHIDKYVAIYLAVVIAQASLNEIAEYFGKISYFAVAKTFKSFTDLLETTAYSDELGQSFQS